MERYLCIHAHFYQPPRENPWLEAVELQDSAYPYHDWNERISAECYAPNTASRTLDENGRIAQIASNYAQVSFNVGPTLLSWMQEQEPAVYQGILEADAESRRVFSGHGAALAQAYGHMILPLANAHDKRTQVLWGIRDFEYRFKRKPEGMWLPETAVDVATLDALAEHGIAFTILAPHQAARVRPLGDTRWQDVSGARIDPTTAYVIGLPSGRRMSLFFYDGPISRAVAFEGLLSKGETFAQRLMSGFSDDRQWPQLAHIATDGETYGHHHRFGDMALAYALHHVRANNLARITNYGEYLAKYPPTHEVRILENTSWSCAHGVERWRGNCGCKSGRHPTWHQEWRGPLRAALDWLRDTLAPKFETRAGELFADPWAARDDYIGVVLDRSPDSVQGFLDRHATHPLAPAEAVTGLKLLEMQRHAMLMYTSCGWFFDDISGIETVQVMQYAGRAVQLAEELFGEPVEGQFRELLQGAKSNVANYRHGGEVYDRFVKPTVLDWRKVGAHLAVSSMFEEYSERARIFCYAADIHDYQRIEAGRTRLALGRANLTSLVTRESAMLTFAAIHFGDHNLNCGVREFQGDDAYRLAMSEMSEAFSRADFPEVIRLMDTHFGEHNYSLGHLFRDEQRKVLDQILESSLAGAADTYRRLYESEAPLMRYLAYQNIPVPKPFLSAAEFFVNSQLRRAMSSASLDVQAIMGLLEQAAVIGVDLDTQGLGYLLAQRLEAAMAQFAEAPNDLGLLERVAAGAQLAHASPLEVDPWAVQNLYYRLLRDIYPKRKEQAATGDQTASAWVDRFTALGESIAMRVP